MIHADIRSAVQYPEIHWSLKARYHRANAFYHLEPKAREICNKKQLPSEILARTKKAKHEAQPKDLTISAWIRTFSILAPTPYRYPIPCKRYSPAMELFHRNPVKPLLLLAFRDDSLARRDNGDKTSRLEESIEPGTATLSDPPSSSVCCDVTKRGEKGTEEESQLRGWKKERERKREVQEREREKGRARVKKIASCASS